MTRTVDVKIETAQLPLVNTDALDETIRPVCLNYTGLSVDRAGVRLHFFHDAPPEEKEQGRQLALQHNPRVLSKEQVRLRDKALAKEALKTEIANRPGDTLAQVLARYLELDR